MRRGLIIASTCVLALAAACDPKSSGQSSGSAPAPAVTTRPGPTSQTMDPAPGYAGTVGTTFRGTHGSPNVNCSAIDTEFLLRPDSGTIQWHATGHDTDQIYAVQIRAALPDVTIEPASGLLGPGQSQVIHVSGQVAAPAKQFWVWVVAPNSAGAGGQAVEFDCRGR
jgi:hypothetical protein